MVSGVLVAKTTSCSSDAARGAANRANFPKAEMRSRMDIALR